MNCPGHHTVYEIRRVWQEAYGGGSPNVADIPIDECWVCGGKIDMDQVDIDLQTVAR